MEATYDIFNQSSTFQLLIGDFGLEIMGGVGALGLIFNQQSTIPNPKLV